MIGGDGMRDCLPIHLQAGILTWHVCYTLHFIPILISSMFLTFSTCSHLPQVVIVTSKS
jgi:hypothetical protein